VRGAGGHVHYAETAEEACAHRARRSAAASVPARWPRASRWSPRRSAQRGTSSAHGIEAGRDRSRRIHHPASRRAPSTSSRRRASQPGSMSRPISAASHTHLPSRARSFRAEALLAEARAVLRRSSSPPMSASPAPTSSSPRRARRSSSPTKATATSRRSCPRCISSSPRSRRSCRRSRTSAR
jgi:hypothetical protein